MLNPKFPNEICGNSRAVRSPAPDTGRYQHSACTDIEIFTRGDIFQVCANRKCPNKGAGWALLEKLA